MVYRNAGRRSWRSRDALARAAILDWLKEPNVNVTLVEVAYGARDYVLSDLAHHPRVTHVPVRAATTAWSKENCLNIGVAHLPQCAKYVGTFDADIHFRKAGWAGETVHALQLYPVIQPWKTALDLGPNDELIQTHTSFASISMGAVPSRRGDPRSGNSTAARMTIRTVDSRGPGRATCSTGSGVS